MRHGRSPCAYYNIALCLLNSTIPLNHTSNKSTQNRPAGESAGAARYRDVDSEHHGQRLDNFLLASLKGVPRSHVYRLIRSGQVRVNSGRSSPSYRVVEGDRVRIPPVRQRPATPALGDGGGLGWLEERIVYEDSRLLVLDKPAGLAVHGGSGVSLGCIEALRSLRPGLKTLELAHRLDRPTSGCLLVAKRRSTLRVLHELLRQGLVEKRYLALLAGNWQHGELSVTDSLVTQRGSGDFRVRVDPSGKPALSRFRLLEHYGRLASYMEVDIGTGRTHQIRVHAAHMGHAVAGDERYGDAQFNRRMQAAGLKRMFLHAHSVAFDWPDDGGQFSVSLPLPPDLAGLLQTLHSG